MAGEDLPGFRRRRRRSGRNNCAFLARRGERRRKRRASRQRRANGRRRRLRGSYYLRAVLRCFDRGRLGRVCGRRLWLSRNWGQFRWRGRFRLPLGRNFRRRWRLGLRSREAVPRSMGSQPPPDCQGDIIVQRAGMRLLFVETELGQNVQNHVRLHFQLARQLIDADLTHIIQSPDGFTEPADKKLHS